MKNYVCINGNKIQITDEQAEEITKGLAIRTTVKLSEKAVGDTFRIGEYEFVVLEHREEITAVILKGILEDSEFGKINCDFKGSIVKTKLEAFADKIESIIGEDNLIEHTVDLTSNDGLKDYGTANAKMSLLTADLYRRYVEILDNVNPDAWWWLATPYSTPKHGYDNFVLCVSPGGSVYSGDSYGSNDGVRPFCILNSNIFVS
jgi:hypothetical protein